MRARSNGRIAPLIAGVLGLLAACGSENSRAPETQAGAVAPEPTDAEAPADAFATPREQLDEDDRGDDLDDLLAMEADLGRYEATLWRSGVPVRAYAQRGEGEPSLGAADGERGPAKDAAGRDRAATATPPASKPANGSGSGGKAGSSRKTKKAEKKKAPAPTRPDAAGARPSDLGDEFGGLAKNDVDPAEHCETVCEVATAICEIETRVCEMADRHTDDPRYQNACERAADDCRVATQACQQCSAEQGR